MAKLIIGLTGLIGSGKSMVAKMLQNYGACIIDTDEISHEITQAGSAVLSDIASEFGMNMINNSGELDRARLRRLVFNDDIARQKLEDIMHPKIISIVNLTMVLSTEQYIVIVVPLLFKTKDIMQIITRSVFVDCPQEILINRVMARNSLTREEVLQILATQTNRELQLKMATDIIINDGTIEELESNVMRLHRRFCNILDNGFIC